MKPVAGLPVVLLLAAGFALHAQQSTARVALRVVALDSAGQPVPDLAASDFKIFDNGSPRQIASVQVNQTDGPSALVILFDLLNTNISARGEIWDIMKTSLSHLPDGSPLYLYLLVEDGSLYPVHGLPGAVAANQVSNAWLRDIGPLLDAAMRKTVILKPQDLRPASPIWLRARFDTTCKALDDMRARMAPLRGPKELLWVTYGFPSQIRIEGTGWVDGGPILRRLGARFAHFGIAVYTADPGLNLDHGILNRDALDILTGATGGRAFPTVDLSQAVTQAEADARLNYSLEYQPPAGTWDGKYHKLRVTVARKGVRLQTESGYLAAWKL
jgi:VWFA-related protein